MFSVIVILAVMFVISCWVMIAKAMLVGRIDGDNRAFLHQSVSTLAWRRS